MSNTPQKKSHSRNHIPFSTCPAQSATHKRRRIELPKPARTPHARTPSPKRPRFFCTKIGSCPHPHYEPHPAHTRAASRTCRHWRVGYWMWTGHRARSATCGMSRTPFRAPWKCAERDRAPRCIPTTPKRTSFYGGRSRSSSVGSDPDPFCTPLLIF